MAVRGLGRVLVAMVAGLLGLGSLAACTGSGSSSPTSVPTQAAGIPSKIASGTFSAAQLKGALLSRINGTGPEAAPDAGSYASLPEIQAAAAHMLGMTITPKECMPAAGVLQGADLDAGTLGHAPAAVVNFRIGADGVSEVLAATAGSPAAAGLAKAVPAACAHYSATAGGKTLQYAVRQVWVQGIGKQSARILNISSVKQRSNVWSVLYRGQGFIGAITVVGPNASEVAVRELGQQAYSYAAQQLLSLVSERPARQPP
jgi:hypothetical protein